jgi:hypothetical protein
MLIKRKSERNESHEITEDEEDKNTEEIFRQI